MMIIVSVDGKCAEVVLKSREQLLNILGDNVRIEIQNKILYVYDPQASVANTTLSPRFICVGTLCVIKETEALILFPKGIPKNAAN